MIAVVGLLLTTIGGNDVTNSRVQMSSRLAAEETQDLQGVWLSDYYLDSYRILFAGEREGERIDVQLHTRAHLLSYSLQAQGRTPTVPATKPHYAGGLGAVDGVLPELQAPLEPEYGGMGRTAELICAYPWPQGCDYWIEVARCESTLGQDPDAYADWNPYVGVFQIWVGHGYGREWLKDDANNTLAAWELSHEGTYTGAWWHCQWQ